MERSLAGYVMDAGLVVAIALTALSGNFWYLLAIPAVFIGTCFVVIVTSYCQGFCKGWIKSRKELRREEHGDGKS